MLLTSRSRYWPPLNVRNEQRNVAVLFSFLLCIGLFEKFTLAEEEGDACQVGITPGVCTPGSKCLGFDDKMRQLGLTVDDVVRCGIGVREEIVCCPGETKTSPTSPPPIPTPKPTTSVRVDDRPAKRACSDIEKELQPLLTPHILGGTPVGLGEYPHMVAIGFSTIGNQGAGGPYSFRCGGALIDHRFVLTAAHCVNQHELTPEIVRMGVVNFTDPDQMRNAVELKISETHIHPSYKSSSTYNDIAVLELERDVIYSENVFPICLYLELENPPANFPLFVAGWGTINTKTRETSTVLLKARQQIVAPQSCNGSYVLQGLNRRISEGIVSTQLCTTDPEQKKDACQGDSGGPLTLVLDEAKNQYSLVGIISAGFSCASSTPGLYSRVASFLDFIESIVWPTTR